MEPGDPTHGNTLWGGDLSNLAENRLPDGDTVPQPPDEPEPEPSWWWKFLCWPLPPFRHRKR